MNAQLLADISAFNGRYGQYYGSAPMESDADVVFLVGPNPDLPAYFEDRLRRSGAQVSYISPVDAGVQAVQFADAGFRHAIFGYVSRGTPWRPPAGTSGPTLPCPSIDYGHYLALFQVLHHSSIEQALPAGVFPDWESSEFVKGVADIVLPKGG